MPIKRGKKTGFTYGKRGRPRKTDLPLEYDGELFVTPEQSEDEKRKEYEGDFWLFLRECFNYPDLDTCVHKEVARFISRQGKGHCALKDRWFNTRSEVSKARTTGTIHASYGGKELTPTEDLPYGIALDGEMRGLVHCYRGEGREKLLLIPRGHLKSTIATVSYTIWRIIQRPAIRILLANATATNAYKFVRAIQWQFMHSEAIKKYWPHLFVDEKRILSEGLTWKQTEFSVPRGDIQYEAGEQTVEGIGVGNNLVSRHYDLIIADDLVNDKNVSTPTQIEKTWDWFQNMHSLLEPGGEIVVIGTRWDYTDLYSTLINHKADEFSIFIMSARGEDQKPMFPKKFSDEILTKLARDLGGFKFSAQFNNQPVDNERADFKKSWLKFYRTIPDTRFNTFATMDPAFTEADGDATAIIVASVSVANDWYIREIVKLRCGDLNGLIDTMFSVFDRYPELVTFGLETRGFQRTIAHGLREHMDRRNKYFPIQELKGESNLNKRTRIMRLIPRFEQGKVFLRGKDFENIAGDMKALVDEYTRFPRGKHDDVLDALAYMCDVAYPPVVEAADSDPRTPYERIMAKLRAHRESGGVRDEHCGTEF